jgi:hypothetical protein
VIALAAALLLAQAPAPRDARPAPPPAKERAGEPAPERRAGRTGSPDQAEAPDRARAVDPSDEEVIRNLELLEKLDLLLRLELFDPAGEPPAKQERKKQGEGKAKPPERSGDAPKR